MIDLIAAAGIGGIIGFGTCAFLTMGKVADEREYRDDWELTAVGLTDDLHDAKAAHDRCADALETARNRIEYALEQETPGSNATVKRIARILRGEQG